jgi:PPOX class probable F420-dependent enzyme
MVTIPESHIGLLEGPYIVALATVQPDGQPQVTPIWADVEHGLIRVNTAAGRQKWKNLIERPQATVLVVDPEDTGRWIEIRGKVVRHTEEGGDEIINKLSLDYTGEDYQDYVEGQVRVTFYIEPVRVVIGG